MKISMKREPNVRKTSSWFGLVTPKQYEEGTNLHVTVDLTEEEKEIIRRNDTLQNMLLYENPTDAMLYNDWLEAREKRLREGGGAGGYLGGLKTYPRYQHSILASRFLEQATQVVGPFRDDVHLVATETEFETNLRKLKDYITTISTRHTDKRELDL